MKQFHTVVLERFEPVVGLLETEPYEAGWADEAIFFVDATGLSGTDATLEGRVQVSVDGIHWIDEGGVIGPATDDGPLFTRVRAFGGWLRATFEVVGEADVTVTVQLALKG